MFQPIHFNQDPNRPNEPACWPVQYSLRHDKHSDFDFVREIFYTIQKIIQFFPSLEMETDRIINLDPIKKKLVGSL